MHEVAESASRAFAHLVLATAGFSEVSNWGEFCMNRSSIEPPVVQLSYGLLRVFFVPELYVNIANQVVAQIVTNVHFFNFTILVF